MMTESEIQLVGYVESILRTRGYADLADGLTEVAETQAQRRARVFSPQRMEFRAAG